MMNHHFSLQICQNWLKLSINSDLSLLQPLNKQKTYLKAFQGKAYFSYRLNHLTRVLLLNMFYILPNTKTKVKLQMMNMDFLTNQSLCQNSLK